MSGFGGTGMHQARTLSALPDCGIALVYDPKPAGRQRAQQLVPGARITDDFAALLDPAIDVLSLCSPFHVHAEQMARGLAAGKHVLSEQPLTGTMAGCSEIVRAARARPDLHADVQHLMRFVPLHRHMKSAVQEGRLGRVAAIEAYSVQDARKRLGLYDTWAMETAPSPLMLAGCHAVDLLRWILDDEVEEVTGMAGNTAFPEYRESDLCTVLLRFRSGTIGRVMIAFAAGRPADPSVRIIGSDACIENNLLILADGRHRTLTRPALRQSRGAGLTLRKRLGGWKRDLTQNFKSVAAHHLFGAAARLYGKSAGYPIQAYPMRLHEHAVGLRASLLDFLERVRAGRPSGAPILDAARTVAVCLAGVEAYRAGRVVPVTEFWPFAGEGSPMAAVGARPRGPGA